MHENIFKQFFEKISGRKSENKHDLVDNQTIELYENIKV